MTLKTFEVRAVEPLMFRDGRPLADNGGAARSMLFPLPSTLAGCIRSRIGEAAGLDWDGDGPERALATEVAGPVPCLDETAVFPAPCDAVIVEKDGTCRVEVLRPASDEGGCDLPAGLRPLVGAPGIKSAPGYRLWRFADIERWLLHTGGSFDVPANIAPPQVEERVHVELDTAAGTALEGRLYTTSMVSMDGAGGDRSGPWTLLARCGCPDGVGPAGFVTPGGERRLAILAEVDDARWPACSKPLAAALAGARRLRMFLATPALFSGGWLPGWLDADLCGNPPGIPGLRLRLVAAASPRREPVSGWDYRLRAAKPVRWMVPAGAVYFFEVVGGSGSDAAGAWLNPVSDGEPDRRDGFGLAIWGVW